jgi:RND family efflux transporter MFP subunit
MTKIIRISFLFLLSFGCKEPEVKPKEIVRPIKILEVAGEGRTGRAEYPGRVAAADEVELAFEVQGRLIELNVKEGERIKKGTVVARLDNEQYAARLELTLAKEKAARSEYDRAKQLFAVNANTEQELEMARRNFEVAEAQTRVTQKSMNETVLKAPFSGVIAKVNVDNFQSVQAKQPVAVLHDANINGFEVKADIPERDVVESEKGLSLAQRTERMDPKVVISGAEQKEIPAYFKEVTTIADPTTRTFEITFGFNVPEDITVAPGMTARVILTWAPNKGAQQKLLIPTKAIAPAKKGDAKQVWTIDTKTMTAKATPVKLGKFTGDKVEVLSGLKVGASIAISGVQQLRDGMKVSRYQMKNY